MDFYKNIIFNLNKVYREDSYLKSVIKAISIYLDKICNILVSIKNNWFFDTLDEDGAKWWENLLLITPKQSQTLSDRGSAIQAKWLSNNHNCIDLIQKVCDLWSGGEAKADFIDGKISIKFDKVFGIPQDFETVKESVAEIKPAHLGWGFSFKHLLKKDIHNILAKNRMENYKKNQYCAFIGES